MKNSFLIIWLFRFIVVFLGMDLKEAIKHVRARSKPYVGVMPESTFYNTLRNMEAGLCKKETILKFFDSLGYDVSINLSYGFEYKSK